MKKVILAVVAVFVAWQVLDFLVHGVLLAPTYAATQQFWRPMEEMKHGLMIAVCLISAVAFVLVYSRLVAPKTMANGLQFGLLLGVAWGISMGYGTYSVMPLPYNLALVWFLGTLVEMTVAGLLVGLIIKE